MSQLRVTGINAFYIILSGLFVSALGSYMTNFALSVWVFQKTGSATAFSTLIFFAIIPSAIGSLFAGPYVDRWNRRRVMIGSDLIASLSTVVIMLFFYAGILQQWQLYIAFTISGLANSFFFPAFNAIVPMIVTQEQLGRVSGITQGVSSLVPIVSAPMAGVLVTEFGLGTVFVIDFVTFLVAVLSLLVVLIPDPVASDAEKARSFLDDLFFGLYYIWARKPLVYLISIITIFIFFNGILAALLGPLVLSFTDAQAYGLIYASFGLGALVGSALLSIWGGAKRRVYGIFIGMLAAGIGATIAGIWLSTVTISIGLFLFGSGYIFLNGLNQVILQTKVAPSVLGRVFALNAVISLSVQACSTLIAGPLATNIFDPLFMKGGLLADSIGVLIGTGPGRGSGLIYTGVGIILLFLTFILTFVSRIRFLEVDLPDYTHSEP